MTFYEFSVKFINIFKEYDNLKIIKWDIDSENCEFIDYMSDIDFSYRTNLCEDTFEYIIWYTDEFRLRHYLKFECRTGRMTFQEAVLFAFLKLGYIHAFTGCLLHLAMCYCKIPIIYLIEMFYKNPDVLKILLNTDFVKLIFDTHYFRHNPEGTFKDVAEFKDGSTIFDIDIEQLKMIMAAHTEAIESKVIILDYMRQHQDEEKEEIGL